MLEEKKKYLKLYVLQETVINRYINLSKLYPENVNEYKLKIKEAENLRIKIEEKISKVEDPLLCELLNLKYVFGKTLEEISLILNYSKRHIERLHIKALNQFEL